MLRILTLGIATFAFALAQDLRDVTPSSNESSIVLPTSSRRPIPPPDLDLPSFILFDPNDQPTKASTFVRTGTGTPEVTKKVEHTEKTVSAGFINRPALGQPTEVPLPACNDGDAESQVSCPASAQPSAHIEKTVTPSFGGQPPPIGQITSVPAFPDPKPLPTAHIERTAHSGWTEAQATQAAAAPPGAPASPNGGGAVNRPATAPGGKNPTNEPASVPEGEDPNDTPLNSPDGSGTPNGSPAADATPVALTITLPASPGTPGTSRTYTVQATAVPQVGATITYVIPATTSGGTAETIVVAATTDAAGNTMVIVSDAGTNGGARQTGAVTTAVPGAGAEEQNGAAVTVTVEEGWLPAVVTSTVLEQRPTGADGARETGSGEDAEGGASSLLKQRWSIQSPCSILWLGGIGIGAWLVL